MRRGIRRGVTAALSIVSLAGAAQAQELDRTPPPAPRAAATSYLVADHWAVEAAWRAQEMGLTTVLLPAQRMIQLGMVEAALREAAGSADAPPRLRALAAHWYARFADEFPGLMAERGALVVHGASADGRAFWHTGRVSPGLGEFPNQTGSEPVPDFDGVAGSVALAAAVGRHVAVQLAPWIDDDGLRLATGDLTLAAGSWAAAVGRQPIGYGWARAGGLVLSGAVPLDRVEVTTTRGIRLPGLLARLGPVAFHTFLSRLPEGRHPGGPYFWGARAAMRPNPRVELAVQRAAMFGGSGTNQPITTRAVLRMLAGGIGGGGFENQIVSVSARYRVPTDSIVPLTVYAEWGAEDAAGAWFDVPGFVFGIETPAVPGVPELYSGVEFASFASSCCGNPPWYRHHAFPGSWASARAPLGHALGGNGSEIVGHAGVHLLDLRVRVEARGFRRVREDENLFVPGRPGAAVGFSADAAWRASRGAEIYLTGSREAGDGWAEAAASAGARLFLAR